MSVLIQERLTEADRKHLNEMVNDIHNQFVDAVKDND